MPLAIPLTGCHRVQRIHLILSHSLQSCATLHLPCYPCHATTREITSKHGKKQDLEGHWSMRVVPGHLVLYFLDLFWFFSAFPLSCPQGTPLESESISLGCCIFNVVVERIPRLFGLTGLSLVDKAVGNAVMEENVVFWALGAQKYLRWLGGSLETRAYRGL